MRQRGVVLHHEHRIGYVIIRDEFGNHTVVKLLAGSDIERGDIIIGSLHGDGDETFHNETQDVSLDVHIQGHGLSEDATIQMIQKAH